MSMYYNDEIIDEVLSDLSSANSYLTTARTLIETGKKNLLADLKGSISGKTVETADIDIAAANDFKNEMNEGANDIGDIVIDLPYYNQVLQEFFSVLSNNSDCIYFSDEDLFYMPNFKQGDERWAEEGTFFGKSTLHDGGCSVCSFSSAISYFLQQMYPTLSPVVTPKMCVDLFAEYLGSSYCSGNRQVEGTYHGSNGLIWADDVPITATSRDITGIFGVDILELKPNRSEGVFSEPGLKAALDSGGVVVCSLRDRGHVVCIRGYKEDTEGNTYFYVTDSESLKTKKNYVTKGYVLQDDGHGGLVPGEYVESKIYDLNTGYRMEDNPTIKAKKAWVIYTGDSVSVDSSGTILVNNQPVSPDMPQMTAYETAGKGYLVSYENGLAKANDYQEDPDFVPYILSAEAEQKHSGAQTLPQTPSTPSIPKPDLSDKPSATVTLSDSSSSLNFRADPDVNGQVIRTLGNNEKVYVLDTTPIISNDTEWIKVADSSGSVGYVATDYVKL